MERQKKQNRWGMWRTQHASTHLLALGSFLAASAGLTLFHTPPKEPFDISSVMLTVAGSHLEEGEGRKSAFLKKRGHVPSVIEEKQNLKVLIEEWILNEFQFRKFQRMNPSTNLWIFFICSHFFQDWQVHPVGHVGAFKKETTSTKTTAEQKGIYFKFPSSGTCTMPSSSAMMLCSSWGQRGEGDVQQHLFMHSFIHLIFFLVSTSAAKCRANAVAPLVAHPPVSSSSTRASGRPASSAPSWWTWSRAACGWTPAPGPEAAEWRCDGCIID